MTNKNMTKTTALMLAGVLVTSCFVGGTMARYVTSTSSEDGARVAIWGINGDTVTMELFNSEYDVNGNKVAKSWDGDKIIAPGTSMASKFSILNLDMSVAPEVMYEVGIELDDAEIDQRILDNPSIQWKLDDNPWGTWEECKADVLELSGDIGGKKVYAPGEIATDFADGKEHTIAWQWIMDNNNDVNDTLLGNLAADGDIVANVAVKVTARQVDVDTSSMLSGDGSIFNVNAPSTISFRSEAPFTELQSVKVGDTTLNEGTDYTAREGSTVIELSETYLNSLEAGRYVISIISANTTANATFTVVNKTLAQDENGNYLVSSVEDLRTLSELVNSGANNFNNKTILLTRDLDLRNQPFTPIGNTVNGSGDASWNPAIAFSGTFNGQDHTIYNLNATATDKDTNSNSTAGLFGAVLGGTIENLNIDGATITSSHFAGVIAGVVATSRYAYIKNCTVSNATVTSTYYNEDNSGDKAGVAVGCLNSNYIENVSVIDSTVTASRDAGQVVGAAKPDNVTGCTVTNVTVSHNGLGTGANIRNEIIGRLF